MVCEIGSNAIKNSVTIHFGHLNIAENQIRQILECQFEPFFSIGSIDNLPTFSPDRVDDQTTNCRVIFDDQNKFHPILNSSPTLQDEMPRAFYSNEIWRHKRRIQFGCEYAANVKEGSLL